MKNEIISMRRMLALHLAVLFLALAFCPQARGAGISVDAGLTPPQDRWILRSQVRYLKRDTMDMYMSPLVVAYGLFPELALMARAAGMRREMSMGQMDEAKNGIGDFLLLAKYKLYRLNTRRFVIGLAPTLALEAPSGSDDFSSKTWDAAAGIHLSARVGRFAADLNATYTLNGLASSDSMDRNPGDVVNADLAAAYQVSLTRDNCVTLTPVLELNFAMASSSEMDGAELANTGESHLYLSPGLQLITRWVILETLVQLPVWQTQTGMQPARDFGVLGGIRLLL